MNIAALFYDFAVALLVFLSSLGFGHLVFRLLRIQGPDMERLWLASICGLGLLSMGTLLLGMAHLLYGALFWMLLVPLAFIGIWEIHRQKKGLRLLLRWLAWQQVKWPFRILIYVLILLSASTVCWILLTHAFMPPHEWDEIAYHLTLPKLYVQAHKITYVPFIVHSNWPMNSEMLFIVSLLLGSDVAPHLIMLGIGLLTTCGLLIVAHRHFDDRVGVIAVVLFLTVPLVKRLTGTGLIDIVPGLFVIASLMTFNRWCQERQWPWLALCGACCGFTAGSKLMGGAFPLLFGILVMIQEFRQRPWRLGPIFRYGLLFGTAGLLVAGPWYGRSLLWTGNPIWPIAYRIFGGLHWDALGDEYLLQALHDIFVVRIPRTPAGLIQSFFFMLTRPADLGEYQGGIGVAVPLGALLVGLWIRRIPPILRQGLFIGGGFYLLWFVLVSHQLRFLLPIVPLLSLAAAYLFVAVYDRLNHPLLRLALVCGLVFLLLRDWPWASAADRGLLAARRPYLQGQVTREDWLNTRIDILPVFRFADRHLPNNAKLLLLPYENRTYYLDRDYVWGNPISQRMLPFERFDNPIELAVALRKMGITHIIENPAWLSEKLRYWKHDRALMLDLYDQCAQPIYRQGRAVLFRLTSCSAIPLR